MLSIVKLVLIFLLNETFAYIMQDIERILLPAWNPTSAEEIPLTLKIFGKQIQLNLRRNVSCTCEVWKHDAKDITEELPRLNASDPCYYLHKDRISTAAINFCQGRGWEGLVFLKNDTLEIRPLRDNFASLSLIDDLCVKEEMNISFGKPHLIKRSLRLTADSSFHNLENFKLKRRHVQNTQEKLTIELAVFFDEAAYRMFMPFLDENKEMLHMMILAYVNRIQAVFHHPSLGVSIDISLVHLEIMDKQPFNISVSNDTNKLLDLFCEYAKTRNPPNDNDPRHWDVGLHLTGIDIYSLTKDSLALSKNDVCDSNTSYVIVGLGTTRHMLSGFTSSLIAAHEIGHVLGMHHDSVMCNVYKYIMSFRKVNYEQITWSLCSRVIATKLWDTKKCLRDRTTPANLKDAYDHSRYHDLPGREWTAKEQCELYFRDKNANVVSLLNVCKTLQCELFKKGSYFTGPALEGTHCAHKKECRGGKCVSVIEPPYNFKYCQRDDWSEWKEDYCQSNCLKNSKGVIVKRRSCEHRSRRTASCKGPYYDVVLCNDSLCAGERKTIDSFAKLICHEFNLMAMYNDQKLKILKLEYDSKPGWQAAYDVEKPWKACTIHCRQKNSSTLYAPYEKMFVLNFDPYYPDGTWCHKENGRNYYCRQHYCLPESYS
ncbi:A disintegrin and metalloproteinase with thrombospondin motifs adt-2-like isoform X1 [Linepithema humile]|uniref:A disintegrin and metalloproteinase with thrombospondin motifs adt-2-like isoform X1 n=1 Tax=Linepithema humile TaxID=83485 RepID=UPI0006233AD0|nr:PREDICTED: A disintegrin and metalloproteinase with thrombospondin motifs 19-like isoform X1 [Linepithema humile]